MPLDLKVKQVSEEKWVPKVTLAFKVSQVHRVRRVELSQLKRVNRDPPPPRGNLDFQVTPDQLGRWDREERVAPLVNRVMTEMTVILVTQVPWDHKVRLEILEMMVELVKPESWAQWDYVEKLVKTAPQVHQVWMEALLLEVIKVKLEIKVQRASTVSTV